MSVISCVLLLSLWVSIVSCIPSIYLQQPRNTHVFVQKGSEAVNIPVQYQLFDHKDSDEPMEFCIDLFNVETNMNVIEMSCLSLDINSFAINDLNPGRFMITSYLKYKDVNNNEAIKESRIMNHFSIESYQDSLPKLGYLTTEKEFNFIVNNDKANTADVSFEYTVKEMSLSVQSFTVCVVIVDRVKTDTEILPQTCLDSSQRVLTLKNMNQGDYTVTISLRDAHGVVVESSAVSIPLSVKPLSDVLPVIRLVDSATEYALDPDTNNAAVSLKYQIVGASAAVSQVEVCLQLESHVSATETSLLLDTTCVPREHNVFTLSRMNAGRYTATFTLRNQQQPSVLYQQSAVKVPVEVRAEEEFVPTYKWQRLHAWHTIPSGIETRLPLNDELHKEARIPDPWKLQLSLPSPCKYFLRMDLLKTTSMLDIKKKAASQCKFPPECFQIFANNALLPDTASVEASNFFTQAKRIELDEEGCTALIERFRTQQESKGAY